jgi:hypothetical protein
MNNSSKNTFATCQTEPVEVTTTSTLVAMLRQGQRGKRFKRINQPKHYFPTCQTEPAEVIATSTLVAALRQAAIEVSLMPEPFSIFSFAEYFNIRVGSKIGSHTYLQSFDQFFIHVLVVIFNIKNHNFLSVEQMFKLFP